MGCNGCGGEKEKKFDSRGNVIGAPELGRAEAKQHNAVAQEAREMSYAEYLAKRHEFRENNRQMGNEKVTEFSDEYKRIQVDELVSVYNHDEVHFKLTPTQALAALWEFCHHPSYQKVIGEFKGLSEQIDIKYAELKKDRLDLKWSP